MSMPGASIQKLISDDTRLPAQPSALPVLLQALADEEIEYGELATVIGQFPSIVARLLSLANSAWSAPRMPITTLEWACTHLGLVLIRSVSISLAVSAPFNLMRCPGFDPRRFWYSAFLVADGAEWLAIHWENAATLEPRTLHTAGLLHNLGLLWLAENLSDDLMRAFELAAADEALSVNEALRQTCGTDVGTVSGCLARAWELPGILVSAMEHHGNSDYMEEGWEAAAFLGAAADMMSAVRHGQDCPAEAPLLDRLDISLSDRQDVFVKMQDSSDATSDLAGALCRI